MADVYRPSLRLRPSEQRFILLLGDFIASAGAMGLAILFWYQYLLNKMVDGGMTQARAERLIQINVPIWFYVLPLLWLLLMVESYESHVASSWKKTLSSIAAAPMTDLR